MQIERTEFGFTRSIADGALEVMNCIYIPGYLVPSDLERMAKACGAEDIFSWALENLLASPGATVMRDGVVFNIRTLVPRRSEKGGCKFLTNDCKCSIHADAPFGCAFFSTTMNAEEANKASTAGLCAIMREWDCGGLYAKIWLQLDALCRRAKSPNLCRRELDKALGWMRSMDCEFKLSYNVDLKRVADEVLVPMKKSHRKRPYGGANVWTK